jgi:hypothetical protein
MVWGSESFPSIPDDTRPCPIKSGYETGSRTGKAGYCGAPMLTDVQIRKAKAADKPYKLTDGGGLHVYVNSAGGIDTPRIGQKPPVSHR